MKVKAPFIAALSLLTVLFCSQVFAQSNGVKKHGVIYNIAEDRQVEKVGGIYEPEGLDKYMQRRFDAMDQRLSAIESQISQTRAEILKVLEEMNNDKKNKSVLMS